MDEEYSCADNIFSEEICKDPDGTCGKFLLYFRARKRLRQYEIRSIFTYRAGFNIYYVNPFVTGFFKFYIEKNRPSSKRVKVVSDS